MCTIDIDSAGCSCDGRQGTLLSEKEWKDWTLAAATTVTVPVTSRHVTASYLAPWQTLRVLCPALAITHALMTNRMSLSLMPSLRHFRHRCLQPQPSHQRCTPGRSPRSCRTSGITRAGALPPVTVGRSAVIKCHFLSCAAPCPRWCFARRRHPHRLVIVLQ